MPSGIGVPQYILLNDGFYGVIQLCILVKVSHLLRYSSSRILAVYKCTSKVFIHYVFRMGWWAQYPCRMKELKCDHRCSCYFPVASLSEIFGRLRVILRSISGKCWKQVGHYSTVSFAEV